MRQVIDRRLFLHALAAGLVGASVDVDRLLWVPGARTHFLPPALPPIDGIEGFTAALLREIGIEMRRVGMRPLQLIDLGGQYNIYTRFETGSNIHLKDQFNVSCGALRRESVRPAAAMLVRSMRSVDMRMTVPMFVPTTGEALVLTDPTSGIALRGWTACVWPVPDLPVRSGPRATHMALAHGGPIADALPRSELDTVFRFDILGG